jgi:hypothetical protein
MTRSPVGAWHISDVAGTDYLRSGTTMPTQDEVRRLDGPAERSALVELMTNSGIVSRAMGEYMGSMQTQAYHLPHVVERGRINFEPSVADSSVSPRAHTVRREAFVHVATSCHDGT